MMEALSNLPELERRVIEQSAVGVTYGMYVVLCVCFCVAYKKNSLNCVYVYYATVQWLMMQPIQWEFMALTHSTPWKLK